LPEFLQQFISNAGGDAFIHQHDIDPLGQQQPALAAGKLGLVADHSFSGSNLAAGAADRNIVVGDQNMQGSGFRLGKNRHRAYLRVK